MVRIAACALRAQKTAGDRLYVLRMTQPIIQPLDRKRHFKAVLTAEGGSDLVAPVRRRVVDLVYTRAGGFRGGDRRVEAGE